MAIKENSGAHLFIVLWKAYKALEGHDRRSINRLGFGGLSDFALLEILLHKGPQPVNEIGRRVFLTSGSITTAVDRAVKRGWVERRPSESDRRVVTVHLTEAGRKVISDAFPQHVAALEEAVAGLDAEERAVLVNLLKKLGHYAADTVTAETAV
jgi:MarR family 2-MHQ and catechol resistance regulon transcriptional repressor